MKSFASMECVYVVEALAQSKFGKFDLLQDEKWSNSILVKSVCRRVLKALIMRLNMYMHIRRNVHTNTRSVYILSCLSKINSIRSRSEILYFVPKYLIIISNVLKFC